MKLLRSVASVLISYVVVFGIVMASGPLLARLFPGQYAAGKVPSLSLLWVGTAIFAVASILGGWLCMRLAPSRLGAHLLALFVLGEALGVVTTVVNWSKWPHWNSFVWLAIWPVCLWIGAMPALRRSAPKITVSA